MNVGVPYLACRSSCPYCDRVGVTAGPRYSSGLKLGLCVHLQVRRVSCLVMVSGSAVQQCPPRAAASSRCCRGFGV
ncbi:hypothetical protein PBY51_000367 [Eleginops maclovinus]|uniref:Uncharacterized protein n=1 Tax=Eleginops maclovinus TaxID=56733 RepID=A0AAN7XMU4_ELEMC|nr:hypothetical protein PBY51_000367 [Eleginops maclovinus]